LASFGAQHDPGNSYTLYLMTFALDSVGDVFGSLFAIASGVLVVRGGALPRWLGWVAVVVEISFFLQALRWAASSPRSGLPSMDSGSCSCSRS
jgi:hypothetical protein